MKYRPEIDGLRAIAVVPVVLFHAGIGPFRGGFAGVDVFFVISGYLITSILLNEIVEGRFSLLRFYERRARRILPALFVVLAVASVLGTRFMFPLELNEFYQSLNATLLFASNIYFWLKSDYFSTAAELKPLLHTWSLAVEEQFYLFFPPLLLFLCRRMPRSALMAFLALIATASLLACIVGSRWGQATFYLLPWRAWELLAGALAAIWMGRGGTRPNAAMAWAGLALLLVSLLTVNEGGWPSIATLMPVLGAVFIVMFADAGHASGRILAARPIVGVGMISYSLYLWHQPVLAFARLRLPDEPSALVKCALTALCGGLAYATWRWIETPFRSGRGGVRLSQPWVFTLSLTVAVVLGAIATIGDISDGFPGRRAPSGLEFRNIEERIIGGRGERLACDTDLSFLAPPAVPTSDCRFPPKPGTRTGKRAIILGDSHATVLARSLVERLTSKGVQVSVATFGGCIPFPGFRTDRRDCNTANELMYQEVEREKYELIVLAFRPQGLIAGEVKTIGFRAESSPDVRTMVSSGLQRLLATGAEVLVIEPEPDMSKDIGHFARNVWAFQRNFRAIDVGEPYARYLARTGPVLAALASIQSPRLHLFHSASVLCDGPDGGCPGIDGGVALYTDDNHLSAVGVERMMTALGPHLDALASSLRPNMTPKSAY